MGLPARSPKFSPDGAGLAWQVVQGGAPEIVTADVGGGNFRQLTFWGSQSTRMKGFNAAGEVIATSSVEQEDSRLRWAFTVPLDGSAPVKLPYGPVETIAEGPAVGDERPMVIGSMLTREQAWWKRYRGGTAGKLWIDADGNGEFERLVPGLDGNLSDPMWIDGRVVFLSDHEGYGNLYSVTPREPTSAGIPTLTASTSGTPRRTAAASFLNQRDASGSCRHWTPKRSRWTSFSAPPRPPAARARWMPPGIWLMQLPTPEGTPAWWKPTAPCTGWRTATARPG